MDIFLAILLIISFLLNICFFFLLFFKLKTNSLDNKNVSLTTINIADEQKQFFTKFSERFDNLFLQYRDNVAFNLSNFEKLKNTLFSLEEKSKTLKTDSEFSKKEIISGFEKIIHEIKINATKLEHDFKEKDKELRSLGNDSLKKLEGLENIFRSNQQRGLFGEILLEDLLENIFPKSELFLKKQYVLTNKSRVDFIIFCGDNDTDWGWKIPIDAKFPLTNFQDKDKFKRDILNKVNEIKKRYILPQDQIKEAIMFVPSETVYLTIINEYYDEVINYAQRNNVWLCSPTNLVTILLTIKHFNNKLKISKRLKRVIKNLERLEIIFEKWSKKWILIMKKSEEFAKEIKILGKHNEDFKNKFLTIIEDDWHLEEKEEKKNLIKVA